MANRGDARAITIGRGPRCDIRLTDLSVSSTHATIERAAGKLLLRDAGSKHGIKLDGVRTEVVELRPGVTPSLGDLMLLALSAPMQLARTALTPFFGWRDLHQGALDSAVLATFRRSHVVLWAMPGSFEARIARLVHEHGPGGSQRLVELHAPPQRKTPRVRSSRARRTARW